MTNRRDNSSRQPEKLLSQIQAGLGDSLRDCILVAAFDFEGVLLDLGRRPLPHDPGGLDSGIEAFTETIPERARQEGILGAVIGYGSDVRMRRPIMDTADALMRHHQWTVIDMLRVEEDRFWSYTCEDPDCCPPEGRLFGKQASGPAFED